MVGRGWAGLGPATLFVAVIFALAIGLPGTAPVFAENVPLPTPAPRPKTGGAAPATGTVPPASPSLPAPKAPSFFPFSDKSTGQATAFDDK